MLSGSIDIGAVKIFSRAAVASGVITFLLSANALQGKPAYEGDAYVLMKSFQTILALCLLKLRMTTTRTAM